MILDLENPYRYLDIRGRARIEPDETMPSPTASARSTAPTCASTMDPATGVCSSRSSRERFRVDMSG